MAYEPPRINDEKYEQATNEMWFLNDKKYCYSEDGEFNPECTYYLTADAGVDEKTQRTHAEWVANSARWNGSSSSFRKDRLEPVVPSGWFFRPPKPVPVSYDRASIPDYGPEDFAEFSRKGGFNCHNEIKPHEFHPQNNMRFVNYGI